MAIRPRRFIRTTLSDVLPDGIYDAIVRETDHLLERRLNKANEVTSIEQTNFNPFLLLITSPVYNIFSPYEVAERLQLGSAFHGDDTSFGRFAEEKILPLFGATLPPQKNKVNKALAAVWEPVDRQMEIEGNRYLMSIKAGPWTMNQSHANGMIEKFPEIHKSTGARCMVGITYGRYVDLNNKPALVDARLGGPDWFDYLVGRDFWEFVSGVRDVHVHIFRAIREAQASFAKRHKDETFHERLINNRLKVASSLRKKFDLDKEDDFWETLFNNAFEADREKEKAALAAAAPLTATPRLAAGPQVQPELPSPTTTSNSQGEADDVTAPRPRKARSRHRTPDV